LPAAIERRANGTLPDVLFCHAHFVDPDATTYGGNQVKRRKFITLLGGAVAAWPIMTRAQQATLPVVGFLGAPAAAPYVHYLAAIHQGLKEAGFVEGQNVRFEYRWADGHYDRLPAMAADLVGRRISVIVPIGGAPATTAAKAATSTIPVVFNMLADPVSLGLVASLNRPGGNITGVAIMGVQLEGKRLELLHELVPTAELIAYLINPTNVQADAQLPAMQQAARALGQRLLLLDASNPRELEAAFATLVTERADGLLVGADTFFGSLPTFFVVNTARHAIPAMYPWRSHVDPGGLISYGASVLDGYRQSGIYAGRVLKGEKPADLPIMQATKFELVINLIAAKAIGLAIPETLLARADELIE
jgi:putative ABC transport system substrate-binding protein